MAPGSSSVSAQHSAPGATSPRTTPCLVSLGLRRHRSELYLADEVFLTGTAAHVTAVGELDNRAIGTGETGPITKKLQELYFSTVVGDNDRYSDWCTLVSPAGG